MTTVRHVRQHTNAQVIYNCYCLERKCYYFYETKTAHVSATSPTDIIIEVTKVLETDRRIRQAVHT